MKFRIITLPGLVVLASCLLSCDKADSPKKPAAHQSLEQYMNGQVDKKASARERQSFLLAKTLNDPEWEKRWWVEKVVRLLRAGKVLRADEDIDSLAKLSEDELIDQLTAGNDFGHTILDFNLFFIGQRSDSLVNSDGTYRYNLYENANAIDSAKAIATNGDYLKIFDFFGKLYPEPAGNYESPSDPANAGMTDDQIRRRLLDTYLAAMDKYIADVEKDPNADPVAACTKIPIFELFRLPLSSAFVNTMLFSANGAFYDLEVNCGFITRSITVPRLISDLKEIKSLAEKLFQLNQQFNSPVYSPKTLPELKSVDVTKLGLPSEILNISQATRRSLSNSSTNANRKRAAWVLKHFMCDDLTPITVEAPTTPVAGAHGSATSCFACHYKLDPMAGFFRNYGVQFLNYSGEKSILFDDLALLDRDNYVKQWRSKSSTRDWDIGYIRSTTNEKLNSYGESLEDLSKIVRESREAKRCLVKRLFEYFVAEDQTIDSGYLNYLTTLFEQEAKVSSAAAVKNTVRRLVKSNSFHQTNLDPKVCYDYDPAAKPGSNLPCRVSSIVQRNCTQCHSAGSASGRLDMSQLITLADGSKNFSHLDSSGHQKRFSETFAEIQRRLSSTDSMERMPQKAMSDSDRAELYLWVSDSLTKGL